MKTPKEKLSYYVVGIGIGMGIGMGEEEWSSGGQALA